MFPAYESYIEVELGIDHAWPKDLAASGANQPYPSRAEKFGSEPSNETRTFELSSIAISKSSSIRECQMQQPFAPVCMFILDLPAAEML